MEYLQYQAGQIVNPIFNAAVTYQATDTTTASVAASRTMSPSLFESTIITTTTASATLRQRLFKHFSAEASWGYTEIPFTGLTTLTETISLSPTGAPLTSIIPISPMDTSEFYMASLDFSILKRGTVRVFYEHLTSLSGLTSPILKSNEVGFEFGYRY
jgi:hypothetical protein